MNITCLFRTWPYSCIWLRNMCLCVSMCAWLCVKIKLNHPQERIRMQGLNSEITISQSSFCTKDKGVIAIVRIVGVIPFPKVLYSVKFK